ncbi:gamma-glutamyltransferase family protein, partial [Microbacteriaceae bacterium K1510]|nr:gamma-glutamyltransferase family protein [Microbacteriaceae bacterium K1510]
RKLIDEHKASAAVKAGDPWRLEKNPRPAKKRVSEQHPTGQTTHFSVMDKWGNLVAYTTTIEEYFGTGIMVPGYGFMLNNVLTDFDAEPGGVNQVEPGKRPRSSMSPTIILKDGKPFMAVGSSGGPTIIASVAQTILNVIDHKLPIQQAITVPNIFSSAYPEIEWEAGIDQDVMLRLIAKGHRLVNRPDWIGNVQAVIFDPKTGKMYGGADNSREGTVLGVDTVSFIAPKPEAMKAPEKGAFTVTSNGYAFPFSAD